MHEPDGVVDNKQCPLNQQGSSSNMNQPVSPELISPAAFLAEDGLLGYCEERTLGLANFICPSTGETTNVRSWRGWVGEQEEEVIGDFLDSI